ncbi:uncharacterized protein M6D78_002602 [Vipera latastei]
MSLSHESRLGDFGTITRSASLISLRLAPHKPLLSPSGLPHRSLSYSVSLRLAPQKPLLSPSGLPHRSLSYSVSLRRAPQKPLLLLSPSGLPHRSLSYLPQACPTEASYSVSLRLAPQKPYSIPSLPQTPHQTSVPRSLSQSPAKTPLFSSPFSSSPRLFPFPSRHALPGLWQSHLGSADQLQRHTQIPGASAELRQPPADAPSKDCVVLPAEAAGAPDSRAEPAALQLSLPATANPAVAHLSATLGKNKDGCRSQTEDSELPATAQAREGSGQRNRRSTELGSRDSAEVPKWGGGFPPRYNVFRGMLAQEFWELKSTTHKRAKDAYPW